MDKLTLPATDIGTVFRQAAKTMSSPVMLWSQTESGWKRILAFNPTGIYIYHCGADGNTLSRFVEENSGKSLVGYISYDLGLELMNVRSDHPKSSQPDICFYAYDNYMEFTAGETILHFSDDTYQKKIEEILDCDRSELTTENTPDFNRTLERDKYGKNFRKIIDHILSGDIYQVNYTHKLRGKFKSKSEDIFLNLLKKNPVDFAAYIPTETGVVLSLSPERFIRIKNRKIITEPIKGTRPRSETNDEKMMQELLNSEKEEAELFMITDLLRNDLGKVCKIGSVNVIEKKGLKKLPAVWHTFSSIEGELRDDISPIEAWLSMSPGGSITGCPKKRAIEIIDELEEERRGAYTGSVGVIYPDGELDMNIAIRTVVQEGNRLSLGVGGGITLGSNETDEFDETMAKAKSIRE